MKIQLLSHCIIDFPRRDEARVPLFQAAASIELRRICSRRARAADPDAIPAQLMLRESQATKKNRSSASGDAEDDNGERARTCPPPLPSLSRAQQARSGADDRRHHDPAQSARRCAVLLSTCAPPWKLRRQPARPCSAKLQHAKPRCESSSRTPPASRFCTKPWSRIAWFVPGSWPASLPQLKPAAKGGVKQ